jgi:hypothetical protein
MATGKRTNNMTKTHHMPPLLQRLLPALQYMLILVPALVSIGMIDRYAVNIPSLDDYDAVLGFLCEWKAAAGLDKFYLLFMQHGEHRILSSRLVYVLYDAIAGQVNFRHLIFIGNLQMVVVLLLLTSFIKKCLPGYWVLASFVAGVCLFDLNNWENSDFAMAAMQNYGIMMLFMGSLYCYNRGSIIAAVVLQIICTFSSGNGLVGSAVLVGFNYCNVVKEGAWGVRIRAAVCNRNTMVSALVFAVFTPLYFLHYVRAGVKPPENNAATMVAYFFRFISNHVYLDTKVMAMGAGMLVLAGVAAVVPVRKARQQALQVVPLVWLLVFVLLSMLLPAVLRSNLSGFRADRYPCGEDLSSRICKMLGTNLGDYIPSRYLLYPHMLWALWLVLLLVRLQQSRWRMGVAIGFWGVMLITYNMNFRGGVKEMAQLQHRLLTTDYNYPVPEQARQRAEQACAQHIYCLEAARREATQEK